jgi:hypothetical protein
VSKPFSTPKAALSAGYAYALPVKYIGAWRKAPIRFWQHIVIDALVGAYKGECVIDGHHHTVVKVNGRFYAQLPAYVSVERHNDSP